VAGRAAEREYGGHAAGVGGRRPGGSGGPGGGGGSAGAAARAGEEVDGRAAGSCLAAGWAGREIGGRPAGSCLAAGPATSQGPTSLSFSHESAKWFSSIFSASCLSSFLSVKTDCISA